MIKKPKIILITGASSGMGKETALKLIKEGYIVYGAARRIDQMQDLVDAGGHGIEMDITKDDQIISCVNRIINEQGTIDVLINNAGYAIYGAVEDTTIDEARRQFEVNLFGVARLTQLVLPYMRKQNSGKIINISSMGGKMYTPLGAWYHSTKHALEGWSDCLRLETKQFGIDVIIIEPGAIATEFGDVALQPMLDRSGKGAYSKMTNLLANALKRTYDKGDNSPPSVIANVISEAIMSDKPKTRYAAGKWAKLMIWMRIHLSDKIFDKIIMSQVK
jgi:short-subunit dehydrogenase